MSKSHHVLHELVIMALASTTDNAEESYSSPVIQTTSWYDAGLNKFST